MRALGVDLGVKRIGLAIGDSETGLALPLRTLPAAPSLDALATELLSVATAEECDVLVVGLPLRLNGRASESTKRTAELVKRLEAKSKLEVVAWDERLSTSAAHRDLRAGSTARASDRRAMVDQVAASVFLQSFLDSRRQTPWDPEDLADAPFVAVPSSSRVRRSSR
jgi:putative Holliday junction resolvase